ncbi:putative hAT family C-terminal dimerization region-containing protein 17 [Homarus americanus]|uniref:Putative hAT family C-terminal dimerization region-containing protein 17 n=1 Tax=Homarus americanus TaxID=6706 RepID=A0A8J5TUY7_HOMAM|nr:putative hAT family C-terminal dimerization region-containing protein 17 [Homarus americanus]
MDELYEEYGIVEANINTPQMIENHSEERYLKLFSKSEVPFTNLKKVSAYIFSIPCSHGHTERVFSMMTSAWRNERDRLQVNSVKAELQICNNFSEECPAMYKKLLANRKLLEMASKGTKYKE